MSSRDHIDEKGKHWYIVPPCIFCGSTYVGYYGSDLQLHFDGMVNDGCCPANGNNAHIRPDEYPPEIIDRIKQSRGL